MPWGKQVRRPERMVRGGSHLLKRTEEKTPSFSFLILIEIGLYLKTGNTKTVFGAYNSKVGQCSQRFKLDKKELWSLWAVTTPLVCNFFKQLHFFSCIVQTCSCSAILGKRYGISDLQRCRQVLLVRHALEPLFPTVTTVAQAFGLNARSSTMKAILNFYNSHLCGHAHKTYKKHSKLNCGLLK